MSLHKKSFPLRIFSVNVIKSAAYSHLQKKFFMDNLNFSCCVLKPLHSLHFRIFILHNLMRRWNERKWDHCSAANDSKTRLVTACKVRHLIFSASKSPVLWILLSTRKFSLLMYLDMTLQVLYIKVELFS